MAKSHIDNRYHDIKRSFEEHHQKIVKDFNEKHKEVLTKSVKKGVSLAGAAIIATSILASSPSTLHSSKTGSGIEKQISKENLVLTINERLLASKGSLTTEDESVVESLLSRYYNLKLKAKLQGNSLNEVYGYIGAEQHLIRWPGDSLYKHDYQQAGMAPLRGAFGFFDNEEQEKYYIAVQLHELPSWNKEWPTLKPWYRFRKVFVYNPDNGKAVIAVIGDSGPAKFTGKTFGGSPEVMSYLERVDGGQKGKVVILFIDDPENKIALGPVGKEPDKLAEKR